MELKGRVGDESGQLPWKDERYKNCGDKFRHGGCNGYLPCKRRPGFCSWHVTAGRLGAPWSNTETPGSCMTTYHGWWLQMTQPRRPGPPSCSVLFCCVAFHRSRAYVRVRMVGVSFIQP